MNNQNSNTNSNQSTRRNGADNKLPGPWLIYRMRSPRTSGLLLTPDYMEAKTAYQAGWRYEGMTVVPNLP
ncbi:hypothetical protein [Bifidobacterium goeldii]|uniref:hypothetical protein n=1 Tax=Bifidobacterium goeldii TaxID=2306975 RepID=UPI000F7F5941|nr:hypothetical protein [Bifidobacterium goeldii]